MEERYVVYSKENCSYCQQAKSLLLIKGKSFVIRQLNVDFTLEEFIAKFPEQKTFPMVVHEKNNVNTEEKFYIEIGGYDRLKEYLV